MFAEARALFRYNTRFLDHSVRHEVQNVFQNSMNELSRLGFDGCNGKRILDFGCGQRYQFALQCAAGGAIVTALDVDYIHPDFLPLSFMKSVYHGGIKRAVKSLVRRILFDRRYFHALEQEAQTPLLRFRDKIKFTVVKPHDSAYKLPSDSFDLIFSNAVLEHVADLKVVASEISRMLVTGGFFYAIVHNYFSVSGGHDLEWRFPDEFASEKVAPWDHLRGNRSPAKVFLNCCRPEEITDAFGYYLEIIQFDGIDKDNHVGGYEGERFLHGATAEALTDYPRELLLTRAWRLICRKV